MAVIAIDLTVTVTTIDSSTLKVDLGSPPGGSGRPAFFTLAHVQAETLETFPGGIEIKTEEGAPIRIEIKGLANFML